MEDFSALTAAEGALFEALNRREIKFLIVGLSAAVIQGANSSTRDIDLWFADTSDPRLGEAIREAKGIWISGTFGARPPQIGGDVIGDRLDVVAHMHGLGPFEEEYERAIEVRIDGIPLRVLPLERIVMSKRASARPKDLAALPALEEAIAAVRGQPRQQ
jgi:predicted nucleotidyltransferase